MMARYVSLCDCSECEEQLSEQNAELSRMRTYLTESDTVLQSTDILQKEIADLRQQMAVSGFCGLG